MKKFALLAFAVITLPAILSHEAAAQQCGWYAIGHCTAKPSWPNNPMGWAVVDTSRVQGFRNGYQCIVSGPQSKSGATRDRNILRKQWKVRSAYIKRGCDNLGE